MGCASSVHAPEQQPGIKAPVLGQEGGQEKHASSSGQAAAGDASAGLAALHGGSESIADVPVYDPLSTEKKQVRVCGSPEQKHAVAPLQ